MLPDSCLRLSPVWVMIHEYGLGQKAEDRVDRSISYLVVDRLISGCETSKRKYWVGVPMRLRGSTGGYGYNRD